MKKLILILLLIFSYTFCYGTEYKYKWKKTRLGGPEVVYGDGINLIFNETAYLGEIILQENATDYRDGQYIGIEVSLMYCGSDTQNLYFQRTEHYGAFIESQANIVYKINKSLKMTIRMLKIPFELEIIEYDNNHIKTELNLENEYIGKIKKLD